MWLQRITNYLLTHRYVTIALVFVCTFIPVIGIIGILIAALVTLRKGLVEGAWVTLAASLPYVISFYFSGSTDASILIVVWAAVGVAVLSNVLTWAFAVMLTRGASWSVILQVAALLGVLVVSVIHLIYPSVADWWGVELQAYYTQAKAMTSALQSQAANTPSSADMQMETINITKQYATGFMAAAILFNALFQLIVARWWEAAIFNPGSLRRELHNIRLSQLAGGLFVISFVFWYLGNSVVLDIMPILFMLFGAAGLSLIHYLFGLIHSSTGWFWLSVLYITLIFSMPTSVILVAILGLLDVWLDMRKRFRKV